MIEIQNKHFKYASSGLEFRYIKTHYDFYSHMSIDGNMISCDGGIADANDTVEVDQQKFMESVCNNVNGWFDSGIAGITKNKHCEILAINVTGKNQFGLVKVDIPIPADPAPWLDTYEIKKTSNGWEYRHMCVDKNGSHFNAEYPSRCAECGRIF